MLNTVNNLLPSSAVSRHRSDPVVAHGKSAAPRPAYNQDANIGLRRRAAPLGKGALRQRAVLAALAGVLAIGAVTLCSAPALAQSTSKSGALSGSNSNASSNTNASLTNNNANANQNATKSNSLANSGSNSGSASANNGSTTGKNSLTFNSVTPSTQTLYNVPNVYAPALAAAGSEVCLGSVSAGGAAAGFGLTVGGTLVDQECQLRMNARTLATLGYNVAAREEMCIDPQVRAAMLAAGTPCAADRAAPPQARAEYDAPAAQSTAVTVLLPTPVSASAPSAPGCRRKYQLFGGWYDVCPTTESAVYGSVDNAPPAPAVYASAESAPAETVAQSTPDVAATTSGCQRKYQLFGGWYDECK